MKKIIFFLLVATPIFFITFIMAQENKEEAIPPGMEMRQIYGAQWLVPKGMLVHKKDDLIIFETANEYVSRKLSDMQRPLLKIEAEQEKLNQKIEQLNKAPCFNVNK